MLEATDAVELATSSPNTESAAYSSFSASTPAGVMTGAVLGAAGAVGALADSAILDMR